MLKKSLKIIFVLLLLSALSAIVLRNQLCKQLILTATNKITGLKLSIRKLNLDILSSSLRLQGIAILNPHGFNSEVLANVEEIVINYNLLGSIRGELHLNQVKVKINKLNIIRNSKGQTNITSFKNKIAEGKTTLNAPSLTAKNSITSNKKKLKKTSRPKIKIDRLEVSLKKAVFTDYRTKIGRPTVIVFTSNEPFIFKNVNYLDLAGTFVSTEDGFGNLLESFWR